MIPFNKTLNKTISKEEMIDIYEKIKTPKKLGAIIKFENDFTDSPTVFKYDGKFYMYFIAISKDTKISGYETHIASSVDLVNWEYIGPIFKRNELNHWDSKQCAGYAAFPDIVFGGSNELEEVNGHRYISYLAGNSDGYEPDPLFMGMAKTDNPTNPKSFIRFENPILKPDDADIRPNEDKTLYKSYMFRDPLYTLGYKYVNAYNAKAQNARERILLAVSNDGENWERYGEHAIIDLITPDGSEKITGDPQIILVDNIYVMLFFRLTAGKGAYNTFACSKDLIHWSIWDGKPLIEPSEPWDITHAHKSWLIRHNDKNYHFYCAVNPNKERFIALAVSD